MKLQGWLLAIFAYCAISVPVAAQVSFTNVDGGLSSTGNGSGSTLTLSGSELDGVSGLSAYGIPNSTGNLGSVSFTSGAITSGTLTAGTAIFGGGGKFTITYMSGMIFTGSFTSGSWTSSGAGTYIFKGDVDGMLTVPGYNPATVMGATVQITVTGVTCGSGGCTATDGGGATTFSSVPALTPVSPVPEPGTLTLLGTGLVGLGFFVRRLRTGENSAG